MKNKLIFLYFLISIFTGIYSINSQVKTDKKHKDSLILSLLKKKREYNKKYGYGFRIQIFNGNEVLAKKQIDEFVKTCDSIPAYLKYESPEWKVQVGNYRTHIKADVVLNEIKKKFKGAIVVPRGKD